MFDDYFDIYSLIDYFDYVCSGILSFIISNKVVFMCFFVPIVVSCIVIAFDFILDVRDIASGSERQWDYVSKIKGFTRYVRHKQGRTDMDEVFKKSKEHADYKHKLKIDELEYFRESERIRHQNKIDEFNMYPKNTHKLTYDDFTPSEINQKGNDKQGFVNYVKEFEPQYFDREIRKLEKSALFDKHYTDKRIRQERESVSADKYQRKGINLDIEVED